MRLLYACTHPTLRTSDIRALLGAGFEVVPSFSHIQFRGKYRIDPRPSDNPLSELNREWRARCTLSAVDLQKIQMTDFYRVSSAPFTMPDGDSLADRHDVNLAGEVSPEQAHLINQNIDVIVVQSFPTLVPNIFKWFKGIVVFRIFGNEDPDFSVWTWYKNFLYSDKSGAFFLHRNRYLSLSVFQGITETERPEILGQRPCVLNSVVFETILDQVGDARWLGRESTPAAVTNISYLDVSHSWRGYYEEFKTAFRGVEFSVFGKNDKSDPYCANDSRIEAQIADFKEYLRRYCSYRVFCNIGKIKQHSQYTPFEAAAMGIPVLFLKSSAIGYEASRFFEEQELAMMGMCNDLDEMAVMAEKCIQDVDFAVALADMQHMLFKKVFSRDIGLQQAIGFYRNCQDVLALTDDYPAVEAQLYSPSKNREKRILWAFYHKTNRNEELPLWIEAGYEVVPIKMPEHLRSYQGTDYDDESDSQYPQWRASCSLDPRVADYLRDLNLIKADPQYSGVVSSADMDLLNNHFGYIYIPASVPMALNLLSAGFRGIVLNRYFGHYQQNVTLTSMSQRSEYEALRFFPNYIWSPALSTISDIESTAIAKPDATLMISSLYRSRERLGGVVWEGMKSEPIVGTSISLLHSELNHYYRNFVNFFGHLPYRIFGKNRRDEIKAAGIFDSQVVGALDSEQDVYKGMCRLRVYIEPGMNKRHCHYTPIEALLLRVPVLFHAESGFAHGLRDRLSNEELTKCGMFQTWEELAVEAEKCLKDAAYAADLSGRQRGLESAFSRDVVVQQMKNLVILAQSLEPKQAIWENLFMRSVRNAVVNMMLMFRKIKSILGHLGYLASVTWQKKKRILALAKKLVYLVLVLVGFLEDKRNYKERVRKLIGKI